jgi:DNA-binding transcriptional ArsR family regulator
MAGILAVMLRLWLDAGDLARIRFAERLHPLGTAVLASQALRDPLASVGMASGALAALPAPAGPGTTAVHHLLPVRGRLPDFLTPWEGIESVDAGLSAVRATPHRRIRAEVGAAYGRARVSGLRRRFASGDPQVLDLLLSGLRRYFDDVLAPRWPALSSAHAASVAAAGRTYALSGVDGLLGSLHPAIRWRSPVVEIDTWWDGDVRLSGAGLILVPQPLAGARPRVLVERGMPALVVYPVPVPGVDACAGPDGLDRLVGRTRAAALRALAGSGSHTTSTLARTTGISLSSASEHTAALRAAGLVTSRREGGAMVHRVTPLGHRLLTSGS